MRNFRLILVLTVVYIDMLGVGLAYPVLPKLVQNSCMGTSCTRPTPSACWSRCSRSRSSSSRPLFGALSDRYGRRPLILASLGGSALSYLLMAAAPGLALLAVARLLAGVMGGSFTTAGAYLADITPPEKRAQSFGLIGATFGFGFITGPAIGGVLAGIDLHLPFLAAGALCAVNLLFGLFALPESLAPENRKPFRFVHANRGRTLSLDRRASHDLRAGDLRQSRGGDDLGALPPPTASTGGTTRSASRSRSSV